MSCACHMDHLDLYQPAGVGDLYTDPQIHTVSQEEYGEANLGTKGMALFFSSHICSPLCEYLGLSTFDLSQTELERLQSNVWIGDESTKTVVSLTSPTPAAELKVETVKEAFRRMSVMLDFSKMQSTTPPPPFTPLTPLVEDEFLFQHSENSSEYETSSIDTDSSTKVLTLILLTVEMSRTVQLSCVWLETDQFYWCHL